MTNALAIRMLFRPLRPWKIGGLRVPFTPGVIPRQRHDLAERIGRMVSEELLTADVFERRFSGAAFRRTLQRAVVQLTDRLAATPVAAVENALGVDELVDLLVTPQTLEWVGSVAATHIATYARTHQEPLSREVPRVLEHVPPESLRSIIERIWPGVSDAVEQFLRSPEMRRELEARTRRILHFSLDQLSSIQRLVVSAGQFDRQLESRVPEIVDRAIAEILIAVRQPTTTLRVSEATHAWIRDHGSEVGAAAREAVHDLAAEGDTLERFIVRAWRTIAAGEPHAAAIRAAIRAWFATHAETPVGSLLPALVQRRASIARAVALRVQGLLSTAVGPFVEHLDVRTVVVDRINDLDVARVEGLLLGIIKRHLGWINVFGALLGAIIGALQIVLRLAGLS
jgi:uncharacterized membrane protein YheB (UPF0754 family)